MNLKFMPSFCRSNMPNIALKKMRSQVQWKFLFATGKPFAERWARSTPGGKGKRFRKLPGHVKEKEAPLVVLLKANYGAKRGQVIAGRLVRGAGGRFSSSGAPASAPTRSAAGGKKAPVAKNPVAPKKPTPEQRAQARVEAATAKREAALAAKLTERDRILTEAGLDKNLQGVLIAAMDGAPITAANGDQLAALGLADKATDGTYRLNAPARTVMHAALRGDAGMVNDTLSKARDHAAKLAAVVPPVAGGGGSKKKEPPVKLPPRQTSTPVKPIGGGSAKPKQPPQERPASPQTDPALVDLARRLSQGEVLADDEAQTLIRNGLARTVKGELVLTASGARAIRTKAASPLGRLLARGKAEQEMTAWLTSWKEWAVPA